MNHENSGWDLVLEDGDLQVCLAFAVAISGISVALVPIFKHLQTQTIKKYSNFF